MVTKILATELPWAGGGGGNPKQNGKSQRITEGPRGGRFGDQTAMFHHNVYTPTPPGDTETAAAQKKKREHPLPPLRAVS